MSDIKTVIPTVRKSKPRILGYFVFFIYLFFFEFICCTWVDQVLTYGNKNYANLQSKWYCISFNMNTMANCTMLFKMTEMKFSLELTLNMVFKYNSFALGIAHSRNVTAKQF